MTQDEVDRKTARKAQLETEVQGTTEARKREIDAELAQINADLDAHRRETAATGTDQQRTAGQRDQAGE
jgi:F0F1-type ATP synthase membrane subunit b/b'